MRVTAAARPDGGRAQHLALLVAQRIAAITMMPFTSAPNKFEALAAQSLSARAISACGALLQYARKTQGQALAHVESIAADRPGE